MLCFPQVLALAVNSGLVAFPTAYDTVWSAPGIYLWRPKSPEGYISLGCLATSSNEPPSLTTMVCLHHTVGIEAPLGQCLAVKPQEGSQDEGDVGHLSDDPGANVWCVDNAAATFTVCTADQGASPKGEPQSWVELCVLLLHIPGMTALAVLVWDIGLWHDLPTRTGSAMLMSHLLGS